MACSLSSFLYFLVRICVNYRRLSLHVNFLLTPRRFCLCIVCFGVVIQTFHLSYPNRSYRVLEVQKPRPLCKVTVSRLSSSVFWDLTFLPFEFIWSCFAILCFGMSVHFLAFSTVKANLVGCIVCVAVCSLLRMRSPMLCVTLVMAVKVFVRSHVSLL